MQNKITTGRVLFISFLAILVLVIAQGFASIILLIPMPKIVSSILVIILYVILAFWGLKLLSEKVMKLPLHKCHIDKPRIQLKCFFVHLYCRLL